MPVAKNPSKAAAPQPNPPTRQFSFTDFQVNNPSAPLPADRLDGEVSRLSKAIGETIAWVGVSLNSDGSLKIPAKTTIDEPPRYRGDHGDSFSIAGADPTATALDWAEVSWEWAEHMPDTIPPNILATMGVTGDHWSSRWWANKAAQLLAGGGGSVAVVAATPPPGGFIGQLWFDTVGAQLYVFYDDGTSRQWVVATNQPGSGPGGPTMAGDVIGATAINLVDKVTNASSISVASKQVHMDNQGIAVGYGGPVSSIGEYGIAALNLYTGSPNPPSNANSILGRLDFAPSGDDASNSAGGYYIIWVDSPRNFTGGLAAIKGNAYVMAQITATIASPGSGNQVGDALTVVGGTCTANLNTPPQFYVASIGAGGAVTAVTYAKGVGACDPYPANPVTTTSSRGGATPPALNLTVASSPTVATLDGLYGRVRNQSKGRINDAAALFADGAWNSGGGIIDNAYALLCVPPYATGNPPTSSYGVYFSGEFAQGEISAAPNVDINIASRGFGGIGLQPGNNGRVFIGYGSTVTAITGTTSGAGTYHYMTTAGVAYIDALVPGAGTSFLRGRVYNNGTYYTGWEIANTGVVNLPQGAAAQAPIAVSSASTTAGVTVANTSATGYSQVSLDGTGRDFSVGVGNASEVALGVANKFFVYDATSSAMRMVIDNVGNVGIGTVNPAAAYKLDVTGTIRATTAGNVFGATGGSLASPTNANTNLLFYNISATNFAGMGADNGGNVYVVTGTSAPATRFFVDFAGTVVVGNATLSGTPGGLAVGVPTGGSLGPGKINAVEVRANNVVLTSDLEVKSDIKKLTKALPLVQAIEPKTFKWKDLEDPEAQPAGFTEQLNRGFLAQDVIKALGGKIEDGVDLGGMVAVLWQAVRELHSRVNELAPK